MWVRDHPMEICGKLECLIFWSYKLPEEYEEKDSLAHQENVHEHTHTYTHDVTYHFWESQSPSSNLRVRGAFCGRRWGVLDSSVRLIYQASVTFSRWPRQGHLILVQKKWGELSDPSVVRLTAALESQELLTWRKLFSFPLPKQSNSPPPPTTASHLRPLILTDAQWQTHPPNMCVCQGGADQKLSEFLPNIRACRIIFQGIFVPDISTTFITCS